MANEQTSVPLYAASEILTAANMNISAGTGVPVFATTVTRDAAFGGANEKVLAEGQLCYLSASNVVQYYDGAAWATVGPAAASGMTLISATSMTGQNVNINNCFSATYSSYLVTFDNVIFNNSTGRDLDFRLRVGGVDDSTANSYTKTVVFGYTSTVGAQPFTGTKWDTTSVNNTGAFFGSLLIFGPFTAAKTNAILNISVYSNSGFQLIYNGWNSHNQATSYDGLSILQSGQSFSSGTTRVYGLQNS